MRLTLRTLLAYLDDILEPQDAKELADKIEDSEYASGLVHRIRSSVGRVRLSSPQVLGHGVGTDPNSVAEYLDNTLPPDRVPEFEKVCLESDTHLSEVAACHQVLALVLGEPSQVESSLRERMYQLPQTGHRLTPPEAEASHVDSNLQDRVLAGQVPPTGIPAAFAGDAAAAGPAITPTVSRATGRPSGESRRWWPIAAALVVGLLVMWSVLVAMGPLNRDHPLAYWLGMDPSTPEAGTPDPSAPELGVPELGVPDTSVPDPSVTAGMLPDSSDDPSDDPAASSVPNAFVPLDLAASGNDLAGVGTVAPAEAEGTPSARMDLTVERPPLDPAAWPPPETDSSTAVERSSAAGATFPAIPPDEGAARPITSVEAGGPGWTPIDGLESIPGGASDVDSGAGLDEGATPPPVAAVDPAVGPMDDPPVVGGGTPPADEADDPVPLENIGRFISDREILAIAAEDASWLRLRPRSSLHVGDRLVALPTYRPKVLLATDLQMTIEGGTSLSILEPFDGRTLTIQLHYGRAVLIPVGRDTPALGLAFGDRVGTVTFADADSELAIEVRHERLPGADPQQPAHLVVRMWAMSGRVQWKGADDTSAKTLEAGQLYLFVDDGPGHFLDALLPEWAGDRRQSDSMALASRSLEPQMGVDRSVTLALAEAVEDRRAEVRALAARCLSYLERFEPLIRTLNDSDQRAWWTHQVDALHEALSRSPESADQVRQDLTKVRGIRGAPLYRLLWGYGPKDLRDGADRDLVEYLDSEDLDFRVLGFDNLKRITGAHLMYYPWYTEARRRGSVVKWRKRLEDGLIVYRSPPVIAAELESVR